MESSTLPSTTRATAYHDYADVMDDKTISISKRKEKTFPVRLHVLLSEVERLGIEWIVGWCPHGRSFIIKDQSTFEHDILPLWFRQTKIASFQRQLNIYGFKRTSMGVDRGAYYHEKFLRGKHFLAFSINRTNIKGSGRRTVSSDLEPEPNFYAMKHLPASETLHLSHDIDGIPFCDTNVSSSAATIHNMLQPRQIAIRNDQHRDPLLSLPAQTSSIDRSSIGSAIHQFGATPNSLIESIVRPRMFASQLPLPPTTLASTLPLPNLLGSTVHPFRLPGTVTDNTVALETLIRTSMNHHQNPLLQILSERAVPEQPQQSQATATIDLLNFLAETLRVPKNDNHTSSSSLPR